MSHTCRPPSRKNYEVIVLCALRIEFDAVQALFEQDWEEFQQYPKLPNDSNAYAFGRIGKHNVVLTVMPGMGKKNSTSVATHFAHSFLHIRLGLVVGVYGGVPFEPISRTEIILGDIIISTAVVQYDFGWQNPDKFVTKDTLYDRLDRPNAEIRSFWEMMQRLKCYKRLQQSTFVHLTNLLEQDEFKLSRYPGVDDDILFESTYRHNYQDATNCDCAKCDKKDDEVCEIASVESCKHCRCDVAKCIRRARLPTPNVDDEAPRPVVHFGAVASGDSVMKSGYHRDKIVDREA